MPPKNVMNPQVDRDITRNAVLTDVYPRIRDPFKPPAGSLPIHVPAASMATPEELSQQNIYADWITQPSMRPVVYQRAANLTVNVGTTPVPITSNQFQCDSMVISIDGAGGTSAFFGYGAGVTVLSGIEVAPGIPATIIPENTREQWELQRMLEVIAAILAADRGYASPGFFRAPRVVFNPNEYYLVATGAVSVAVMLFYVPEGQ